MTGVAERQSQALAERERRITATAHAVAAREARSAVTIHRLAQETEHSQPVLHAHVASRDAVVATVAVEDFRGLTAALGNAVSPQPPSGRRSAPSPRLVSTSPAPTRRSTIPWSPCRPARASPSPARGPS